MRSNRTLRYFSNLVKQTPNLTGKEKFVLLRRLRSETLFLIGKKFGVSEGRIRQVEKVAIRKIRSKIKQLSLFIAH